jgi:hypothetical protein
MPKKRPPDPAARLDALEAQITALTEQLTELGASLDEIADLHGDVEELQAAVRRRGAKPNPAPPLSPEARTARARNAALARGAKKVGQGSGKVRSKQVQEKLRREAAAVARGPAPKRRRRKKS